MTQPARSELPTVCWDLDGTLVDLADRPVQVHTASLAVRVFRRRGIASTSRLVRLLPSVIADSRVHTTRLTNHEFMISRICEVTRARDAEVREAFAELMDVFGATNRWFRPIPSVPIMLERVRAAGFDQVVATNPMWPKRTILQRLAWGEVDPAYFSAFTHGENMSRSKPSVEYYEQLVELVGRPADELRMVGNHPVNDGAALQVGIPTFILGPDAPVGARSGNYLDLHSWLGLGG